MAVIGRIRKRVGLLIGFVGVSMLLFILGDVVTSNTGLMNVGARLCRLGRYLVLSYAARPVAVMIGTM